MTKKVTRGGAVLLAAAMLFGLTAGCSNDTDARSKTETTRSETGATDGETSVHTEESAATNGGSGTDTAATTAAASASRSATTARSTKAPVTTTPSTTASQPRPSDAKTGKVYFGFYGIQPDPVEIDTSAVAYAQTDYINVMFCGGGADEIDYSLKLAKKNNCKIWVMIHNSLFVSVNQLSPNWKKRFDEIDAAARNSGAYDALLGYYLDEPLLAGVSHADLLAVTKYNKQNFGKRFKVCFSVAGVEPDVWRPNPDNASPAITKEAAQYLTDVSFNMYWDYEQYKDTYDKVVAGMKSRIGRDDVYVWYVACTFLKQGDNDKEAMRSEHLRGMYNYLMKEKKPGGLLCFAMNDYPLENILGLKSVGFDTWPSLWADCQRIGRDIASGKLG